MLFIFDLDGTLIDTSEGIINCYNYAAGLFLQEARPADRFRGVIGGPLLENFQKYYNMSEKTARKAVEIYREHYAREGIYQANVYEGIEELLKYIRQMGCSTAVATLKREDFSIAMLKHFGLLHLFDAVYGIDQNDTLTKVDLLNKCIGKLECNRQNSFLIGDSVHDANGAKTAKIPFVGVAYGWGFDSIADIQNNYYNHSVNSVEELHAVIKQIISKEKKE
jgi:phosphoglycolate phosphatase